MDIEGGCYCGNLRFKFSGDPMFRGQCHCRECQYFTGGGVNVVMGGAEAGFEYTKGKPESFARTDLDGPVVREFCGNCGTQLVSKPPSMAGALILKAGTFDDPSVFGQPEMAIFGCDTQPHHHVPAGVPLFERGPGTKIVG